ncbi:hypothetical protein PVW48_00360 [Dinoroseobacter sp. PD6]|uniref:hypothetical protein n=1 Tax=Dinoroseobacter sp. PD6 TaxID=3028384 RepID=UPI00237AB1BE|nr:hypothetical protein [Dinoroseobacter sp. PD6]MDD9715186.1 hypothetical protein [Dinoroseobacter sp. PD6]
MIFVVTPETVVGRRTLDTTYVPRKLLSLGAMVYPRGRWFSKLFWRIVFEKSLTRYVIALIPFPLMMLARPDWALALSQAPLAMFGFVLIIETYVLTVSDREKRRALASETEIARAMDLFRSRARMVLARVAAARGMTRGELHLVIEQSGLVRVPKLTFVSVQMGGESPRFLELDAAERAMLAETLFDAELTEQQLQLASLAQNKLEWSVSFDPAAVSAHERLAAMARARG